MMGEPSGPRFTVIISQLELQKLKRWAEWAKQEGALDDFLADLRTLNYRLSFEADEWGEPRYTQKELKLKIRFASLPTINVWYGVHEEEPIVFVKVFQFRTDHPKGQPPDTA
jgi:hypothetical protein